MKRHCTAGLHAMYSRSLVKIGRAFTLFLLALMSLLATTSAFGATARFSATPLKGVSPLNVEFDASASTGTLISNYKWDFGDASPIVQGATKKKVTHTYTQTGNKKFTVKLTVIDDSPIDGTDQKIIEINPPPALVVNAGSAKNIDEGKSVVLSDASASGGTGTLKYAWKLKSGSSAAGSLSSKTILKPTFTANSVTANSVLLYELTVTDSATPAVVKKDTVQITVKDVVPTLTVSAGSDINVNEGSTLTFSGATASGGIGSLKYKWKLKSGSASAGTLSSTTILKPVFTANAVTADAVLVYELTVTDSGSVPSSKSDTVQVTVKNVIPALNVIAGVDKQINEGKSVRLADASVTGGTGNFTYVWTLKSGPATAGTLSATNVLNPVFSAKEVAADTEVIYELTVIDSAGGPEPKRATDLLHIVVKNVPKNPVANAGADQNVNEGTQVTLDGSGSAPHEVGGAITDYSWKSLTDPKIVIANMVKPIFTAPRVGKGGKVLEFSLEVTDNKGLKSNVDTVKITVVNSRNDEPVAVIKGASDSVKPGAVFSLDGSGSTDPDGQSTISTYKWTQVPTDPLQITIVDGNSAIGKFKAPAISATAQVTLILTVTDEEGKNSSAQAVVVVTLDETLKKPIANAGEDISVDVSQPVILDGRGSKDANADGSIISYEWKQKEGTAVTLKDADKARASFTSPASVPGGFEMLKFELKVVDNDSLFDTDEVLVNVGPNDLPVVDAGKDQLEILEGSTVTLSGTASDKDGTINKVEWRQVSGTPEQQVIFSDPAANNVTFVTPAVTGGLDALELVLEFRAFDNLGGIGSDRVKVLVKDNGVTTIPNGFVPVRAANDDEDPVGFDIDSAKLVSLAPKKVSFNNGDETNRPRSIPYGLFDFTLRVDEPGGTATLRVLFPEDVSSGFGWFKYDAKTKTWSSYPNVVFQGKEALITLTDGGAGDADGKANGFIYDPAGLGTEIPKTKKKIEGSSGGGALGGLAIFGLAACVIVRRRTGLAK